MIPTARVHNHFVYVFAYALVQKKGNFHLAGALMERR